MLLQDRRVADRFVDDDIVLRQFCVQRGEQEGRVERARNAFVGGRGGTAFYGCVACTAPACDAPGDALAPGFVGARLHGVEHLLQHDCAIALDSHVGRESPHRKIRFQGIDIDLDPFDRAGAPGVLRDERYIRIQQQAEIGGLEQGQGIEAGETGRILRDIEVDRIEFRDPDAAGPRQPLQHRDGVRLAAEIGGQGNRIFRRHQCARDRIDPRGLNTACVHAAISCWRIGRHVGVVPLLGERLARQHHVDRAGRIALRKRAGAGQGFLHHDAGGQ